MMMRTIQSMNMAIQMPRTPNPKFLAKRTPAAIRKSHMEATAAPMTKVVSPAAFRGLGQGEGQGPEENAQSAVHPENQLCQMRSLVRDVVQIDDQRQDQENHCVDGQHGQIRPLEQFLGIEPGAFKVLGTDTLTDHGDHAHPDGLGWQNLKGGHGVADGICRDGGGAKSRDDAEQHDLSQMKETALKTAGHAQLQYCFDDMSLQAAAERLADMEGIFFIAQEPDHGDSADDSRSQGRDGNAFYTHVETEDQKGRCPLH